MITFGNNIGIPIIPGKYDWPVSASGSNGTNSAIAGAGRSITIIGYANIAGGGTKTISSAGGKIYISRVSSRTFANAGTNLRVGIKDVNGSTGIEDGTFDVYADLVGGSSLPTNSILVFTMGSGSKTISHGDLIAVSLEMTVRGGTDTITFSGQSNSTSIFPYTTMDLGAGPAKSTSNLLSIGILFDDGTAGWIENCPTGATFTSVSAVSPGDELGTSLILPFSCTTKKLALSISNIPAPPTGYVADVFIYSDPFGTPVEMYYQSVNLITEGSNEGLYNMVLNSEISFSAGVEYGIVVANSSFASGMWLMTTEFGHAAFKTPTFLGQNWKYIYRIGGSGSFTEDYTDRLPIIGFYADNIVDPAGGGSGNYTF